MCCVICLPPYECFFGPKMGISHHVPEFDTDPLNGSNESCGDAGSGMIDTAGGRVAADVEPAWNVELAQVPAGPRLH